MTPPISGSQLHLKQETVELTRQIPSHQGTSNKLGLPPPQGLKLALEMQHATTETIDTLSIKQPGLMEG
eukprot:15468949-Alexandrium_andersonii.AAC.1